MTDFNALIERLEGLDAVRLDNSFPKEERLEAASQMEFIGRQESLPALIAAQEREKAKDAKIARLREIEALRNAIAEKGGTKHAPTQWAYDRACGTIEKHKAEIARLREASQRLLNAMDELDEISLGEEAVALRAALEQGEG